MKAGVDLLFVLMLLMSRMMGVLEVMMVVDGGDAECSDNGQDAMMMLMIVIDGDVDCGGGGGGGGTEW